MGFFRWVFLGFFGWVFLGGFFNANPGIWKFEVGSSKLAYISLRNPALEQRRTELFQAARTENKNNGWSMNLVTVGVGSVVDPDPHPDLVRHHFGNLDPHQGEKSDPHTYLHPHQIKFRIRTRIRVISRIRIRIKVMRIHTTENCHINCSL